MSEPYREDAAGDAEADSASQPPGMPRWVKVTGIVMTLFVLALLGKLLLDGGEHGPGRHGGLGVPSAQAAAAVVPLSPGV